MAQADPYPSGIAVLRNKTILGTSACSHCGITVSVDTIVLEGWELYDVVRANVFSRYWFILRNIHVYFWATRYMDSHLEILNNHLRRSLNRQDFVSTLKICTWQFCSSLSTLNPPMMKISSPTSAVAAPETPFNNQPKFSQSFCVEGKYEYKATLNIKGRPASDF